MKQFFRISYIYETRDMSVGNRNTASVSVVLRILQIVFAYYMLDSDVNEELEENMDKFYFRTVDGYIEKLSCGHVVL